MNGQAPNVPEDTMDFQDEKHVVQEKEEQEKTCSQTIRKTKRL